MTTSFSQPQKQALQNFSQELEQLQQEFQSKCYQLAQQLDPQSSNVISKSYDSQSLKGQAQHAGQRAGSALQGSPVEQIQQMILAAQQDIAQLTDWARESSQS